MAEQSDVLVEAFRPGVAERLGLGPQELLARNPKLVYGRLTGWGQTGPLAHAAGHSLNYESLAGAIGSIGPVGGPPVPLLQVLGDFAGGGLHLAYGVVCALLEASRTGKGQVVDAAMVDGVMSLYGVFYSMSASGMHTDEIGTNLFDGGAPFYNVYETSDGRYVSVAPIEPHFYRQLLDALEIPADELPAQYDQSQWPAVRERLAAVLRTRTRDEWQQRLEGTDVCFAPVMRLGEAHTHPHNIARGAFVTTPDGGRQLRPAPRLSGMSGEVSSSYAYVGADTDAVLAEFGWDTEAIAKLRADAVVA
jgi:alpha-methylacyl-CoA racemase